MTDRKASLRYRRVGNSLTAADMLSMQHMLDSCPLINGRWLEVTWAAAADEATVAHGLGRQFQGWCSPVVTEQSVTSKEFTGVYIHSPQSTIVEHGLDPSVWVVFHRDASGTPASLTFTCWFF